MFKRIILMGCVLAMFSIGGIEPVQTANAQHWRRNHNSQREHRQFHRRYDSRHRRFHRRNDYYYRSPGYYGRNWNRRYYGRRYRGYDGYIWTPYFSFGF